jgi:hypothetical protein
MKYNKTFLYFIIVLISLQLEAQSIYKPKGCSASVGPGVSTVVLQNPQDRYQLITIQWSDIEPSPGNFDFTSLQNQINTIKSYNKKYALAIASGGLGTPAWLIDTYNVPYVDYLFQGITPYRLPLWWDTIVQQRISLMVTALGNQFANDSSLALVYVTQMTANGNEGHLNGIDMTTMYNNGFTPTLWINAAKQTTYYYTNSFPDKAIAFEVHDIDNSNVIPSTIINDLYNDATLCQRVGAAIWWLSGKTTYQTNLLTTLQNFQGDKYAQLIAKSSQPERFQDGLIENAFIQAKQLGIRYIEPWLYEYQNNTINNILLDFNSWADLNFTSYDVCDNLSTGFNEQINEDKIVIYPNPVSEYITIINPEKQDNETVSIYTILGGLVKEIDLTSTNQINVSELANGVYFAKFKNHPHQTLKFIKN